MHANYKWCIDRIINKYEGKYSNDPGDPGGPTMYGITYIDAAEYLHLPKSQTYSMMKTFPLSSAENIYENKYAKKARFDELPSGPDMFVLDYDINSGVARGPRVLQALLGLPQTGVMNDATVFAANKADPIKLIDRLCDERLHFMHQIRGGASWQRFGRGWQSRVEDLRVTCKKLHFHPIGEVDAHVPLLTDQQDPTGMGKATHIDPAPRKTIVKATSGSAIGGGAGTHAVFGDLLTTGLIVGGIVLAGGFAYYELVRSQKLAQAAVVIPA